MLYDNRPIGIFDSGLGGLTVVSAIKKLLPFEDIIYLGDTARVPYGNKSKKSITKFGLANTEFLINKDVKLVVVACNSVSAVAIDTIRTMYPDVSILGVIEAGVTACLLHKPSKITITGTRATISSGVYKKNISNLDSSIAIESIPCPLFVPIVEEGILSGTIVSEVIKLYLSHLENTDIQQLLLLGCTHYPLLKKAIAKFSNDNVTIIDSALACAQYTNDFLVANNLLSSKNETGSATFYVTDKPAEFHAQSSRFFGHDIKHIHTVELSN